MQDGWEERYRIVCYNIQMAQTFIKRAEQGGIPSDVSPWGCLIIVAVTLWSAVEIFDDKVASCSDEQLRKPGEGTQQWFKQHEPLVDLIRNGVVHADRPPSGVGQKFNQEGSTPFFWVWGDDPDLGEIPMEEVLGRLGKVADQIKDHALAKTKTWYISFN